ncbi:endonuclease III domain-containing protein [Streptococcus moroccensis]|uniref:Endonuclease-3 related protein n=1 Tax=Streptococcus moroccensis TaxID=1451356 RepID=A0ABT9YRA0_9STRE|nr:deoxyribonuclease I [Streptococcus moroccensis]MDQ0222526.1 endonuclease-3 related protein [Streptococcus moroccensis]
MTIYQLYQRLLENMGHQGNWPADSPEELIAGAILVQNTRWENAQLSLARLSQKLNGNFKLLHHLPIQELQDLIRSSGFGKNKSRALQELFYWLQQHDFDYETIAQFHGDNLRRELLKHFGIGQETADVLLLYIFHRPVFIADNYARQLFGYLLGTDFPDYTRLSKCINLQEFTLKEAQQFHILIDEFGKHYCKPTIGIETSFLEPKGLKINNHSN